MKKLFTKFTIAGILGLFIIAGTNQVTNSQGLGQILGSGINTSQQFFGQGYHQTAGGFAGGNGLVRMFEESSYPSKCPSYDGWYGPYGKIGYPCHSCHDYAPNCKKKCNSK